MAKEKTKERTVIFDWANPKVEAQLRKLWTDGLTASAIAREMGQPKARNAILGKAHRLKLAERKGPPQPQPKAPRPPKTKLPTTPRKPKMDKPARLVNSDPALRIPADKRYVLSPVWNALPGSTPVALEYANGCRFPIGKDHPYLMCNEDIDGKGWYCAAHRQIAMRPVV